MSYRNELPQSGWNLPPGVSENDPYFTDETEEVSTCDGYGFQEGDLRRCGNEKDEDKPWCDECQDSADLDAREEAEARAWREGEPIEELPYPHLTDRD